MYRVKYYSMLDTLYTVKIHTYTWFWKEIQQEKHHVKDENM